MEKNNNWIWVLLLSGISSIFAMIASYNILRGTAVTDIVVVVGLLILAAIQVVIAIIAIWSGY